MKRFRIVSLLLMVLLVSLMLCACEDSNYKQAKKLYAEGNYEEALKCLNEYAADKPDSFSKEAYNYMLDCYLNLGYQQYAQGNFSDALDNFTVYKAALGEEDVSGYIYGCAYYVLLNDITTTGKTEYYYKGDKSRYEYDSYTLSYEDMDDNIMVAYQVMSHSPVSYTNTNPHTDEYDLWIYLPEPGEIPVVPATINWWYTNLRYDYGADFLSREQQTISSKSGELSPASWFTLEKNSSGTKVIARLDNDYNKESKAEKFVVDFFNDIEKTIHEKYLGIEFSDFGFKSLSDALAGI